MSAPEQVQADPAITTAEVMGGETIEVGARVRHFAQRYATWATATVVGFAHAEGYSPSPWVKVLVECDNPRSDFAWLGGWDWDRTVVANDPPWRDNLNWPDPAPSIGPETAR